MKLTKTNILDFYISQVQDNFMPYWNTYVDNEDGGILNCINNYGDALLSDNKFTWSQGRYLWILCKIYELCNSNILTKIDTNELAINMKKTYQFIVTHSIYDESLCCYVLTKDGSKLIDERTGRYDASIFADCFALIGLSQYAKVMNCKECLPIVTSLYESIVSRIEENNFLTEPYPIPDGYTVHSIPMILVNTVYEYIKMRESFELSCENEIQYGLSKAKKILDEHYSDGYIREFVSTDENFEKKMLDRHVNPGHTIEDVWFLYEFLHEYGDIHLYSNKLIEITKKAFYIGWDDDFGGLLRFVDKNGGKPTGDAGSDPFEVLIQNTWDMKLWWPHSEMLYTFLLLYKKENDIECGDLYKKAHDYVFSTFPNEELGEWVQIRKRDGTPEEKLVALPVKDPFHILRNFIKIIELYAK